MKSKKPKLKKYTLTLNECEMRRLTLYAESNGVERTVALHRLVIQSLRNAASSVVVDRSDANQLGLFDTLQIDIFNNTVKVNE